MCGRYFVDLSPELRPIIEAASRAPLTDRMITKLRKPLTTSGEITPTSVVPVLAPSARTQKKTVFPMVWGFTFPGRSTPLINARSETADSKPAFRESWSRHRCIVPASYYFEWEHFTSPKTGKKRTGNKYAIQPKDATVTWLAGLYRIEDGFPHFVILTRAPGSEIEFIHDRMPVILSTEDVDRWIDPTSDPKDTIHHALTAMAYEKVSY